MGTGLEGTPGFKEPKISAGPKGPMTPKSGPDDNGVYQVNIK